MSNSDDADEKSFLMHVSSHLPAEWSVERCEGYLQHVLIEWRKRREHSREEQRMMDIYLATIKEHFKPQSPELYDFSQWPIDENLLAMLKKGSLDSAIVEQLQLSGVYTFNFLPTSFCAALIGEIEHFEQWCREKGLKIHRPNSMNNYGAILDHFGFESCLASVATHIVEPLTRLVYPHVTLPIDSHHGFVVEYAMNRDKKLDFHVDSADVTLNVCLGTEFTGGQLYFGGVRCSEYTSSTKPKDDEEIHLDHHVGTACIHVGKHRHRALPITSGRRLNLILWCRSSRFQAETDELGDDVCPTWCGVHSLIEQD